MSVRKLIAALGAVVGLVATAIVASPPSSAQAFTGSDFNAGYIISDQQFYNANAMSEAEIQAFLTSMVATNGGCANSNCLANYRQNTWTRPADRTVCAQYTGGSAESAARIIFKVQQACGISARVLLVTLQKEQSLVSATAPSDWRLSIAMGYGCPDTAPCDAEFYGFYNQVYKAAWQFKRYSTPDPWGYYQPGSRYIQYNPNPDCGGTWVNIQNAATAALYNYTPYQPNAQSLANLWGDGGPCGAHGNRNFWSFYYSWFGNPTGIIPAVAPPTRLQGADRFATAVEVSKQIPGTGGTIFIANGYRFPDALSAAPAAASIGAPVLLVSDTGIPSSVAAELTRRAPARIVVVGGEAVVPPSIMTALGAFAPEVVRVSGDDRFATSLAISQLFPAGSTSIAYVATGLSFPDALAAGAAAGYRDAPVILVDGKATEVDAATAARLAELGVTRVIIAGSTGVVSEALAASIEALPGIAVTRLGGADRYETAGLIARDAFPTSATVYLALGTNFPDALSGAALAGSTGSALLLAPAWCVKRATAQDIVDLAATRVTLLGAEGALAPSAASFANCD